MVSPRLRQFLQAEDIRKPFAQLAWDSLESFMVFAAVVIGLACLMGSLLLAALSPWPITTLIAVVLAYGIALGQVFRWVGHWQGRRRPPTV